MNNNHDDYDEYEGEGFFVRNRITIFAGVAAVLIIGVVTVVFIFAGKSKAPHKPAEIMVQLLPPPPLPPPPPPPPPPKLPPPPPEQKMVEQPPVKPDEKPKEPSKSPDKPPGPPGPAASGAPSDFGLGGSGGGDGGFGSGGGSKYGWYAGEVQSVITNALRRNDKTKGATVHVKVRIWADGGGRVTRASLSGSSGDAAVDSAIKNEILTGLQLPEPPPSDMPMPIVMMIREQRPN